MTPQATRTRPQRSRLGLLLFLVVLAYASYRLLGLMSGPGDGPIAYEPLPYVTYGLTPDYERKGALAKNTNRHGFRGPDFEVPKPEGTFRIVCLGGSTTYSDQVGDDDAYPLLLQHELRERRPEANVEVINAGVPSYTSAESLANLAFRCLEFEPDMIVVYHGANDYRPRIYSNYVPSYFHYRKPWNGGFDQQEQGPEGTDMAGGVNTLVQRVWPDDNGDMVANARAAGTRAFRRNIVSMIGIAKAHGIEPVLVNFAGKGPDPDFLPGLIDGITEHNRVLDEVAAAQRVTLIDLDSRLTREGTFAQGDPVHLTPQGTRLKARVIAEGLLPLLP